MDSVYAQYLIFTFDNHLLKLSRDKVSVCKGKGFIFMLMIHERFLHVPSINPSYKHKYIPSVYTTITMIIPFGDHVRSKSRMSNGFISWWVIFKAWFLFNFSFGLVLVLFKGKMSGLDQSRTLKFVSSCEVF